MRKIKTYRFHIGTKIPFPEWPQLVHRFMSEQDLHSEGLLYCFADLDFCTGDEKEKALHRSERMRSGPCAKALRDCPALGEVKQLCEPITTTLLLSNIDTGRLLREDTILPLMNKLYRYYGFAECDLFYTNVDFFGAKLPYERDFRSAEGFCERRNLPFDPNAALEEQPRGSMIHLHRDRLKTNLLEVSIDLLHQGEERDPTPYKEAMQALLPKIRMQEFTSLVPSTEEREALRSLELPARAAAGRRRCSAFFNEKLYAFQRRNEEAGSFSVPKSMQKLAAKRAYFYQGDQYSGLYTLYRRLESRAWITLTAFADSGHPGRLNRSGIPISLDFHTLGYSCRFSHTEFSPCSAKDLEAFLAHILDLIEQAEREVLPAFCAVFPPCPEWFEPLPFWEMPLS